jgi:hypothetical protein
MLLEQLARLLFHGLLRQHGKRGLQPEKKGKIEDQEETFHLLRDLTRNSR